MMTSMMMSWPCEEQKKKQGQLLGCKPCAFAQGSEPEQRVLSLVWSSPVSIFKFLIKFEEKCLHFKVTLDPAKNVLVLGQSIPMRKNTHSMFPDLRQGGTGCLRRIERRPGRLSKEQSGKRWGQREAEALAAVGVDSVTAMYSSVARGTGVTPLRSS